jgi:hypothetical protein
VSYLFDPAMTTFFDLEMPVNSLSDPAMPLHTLLDSAMHVHSRLDHVIPPLPLWNPVIPLLLS